MSAFIASLFAPVDTALTFSGALLILVSMLLLGLLVAGTYMLTHKKESYLASFPITLVMMPIIVAVVIMLVGNSVARAFSLAGAFSLTRFRSNPAGPMDIAYVFFTVAVGLAGGTGYIGYAALFAIFLCAVAAALTLLRFGRAKRETLLLKIMIPENLSYQGLFDDIMSKYADVFRLQRVKTKEFGSLFQLYYHIRLRPGADRKEFIDALRCRNGNLDISLSSMAFEEKVYA